MMLGSEGNLGVVTEVTIRVRPVPEVQKYGSIIFPDFELGVNFMREVAQSRIWPASIRLVDNSQFKLGGSLKPESKSKFEDYLEEVKKFIVTKVKGYDLDKISAATLVFEGTVEQVAFQEKYIYTLC